MGFNFKQKDTGIKQPANYAPGKRSISKMYWYILLLLIASPFAYLAYTIFSDAFLMTATGQIAFGEIMLRAPANAYVHSIRMTQGQPFTKEQTIIELFSPSLLSEQQALQKEVSVLTAKKKLFFNEDSEIGKLQQALEASAQYQKKCREYLQSLQNLRDQGATTIIDLENARNDLNIAEQQYYALEADIARAQSTKNVQSIGYFDKNILDTEAKLRALETSIALLNISLPEDGSLAKLYIQEHEYVKEGQDIAKVVLRKDVYVIAYLESRFLSEKMAAKQKVRIRFPNGTIVPGTVATDPVMAEVDPARSGIVSNEKNKIVVKVIPDQPIPNQYKIADLPVDVLFY